MHIFIKTHESGFEWILRDGSVTHADLESANEAELIFWNKEDRRRAPVQVILIDGDAMSWLKVIIFILVKVHIFSDKNVGVFAIFNIYFIFVIVLIFSDKNVRMLASEQTILAAKHNV